MTNNILCLNSNKTEVIIIGPKQLNNILCDNQNLLCDLWLTLAVKDLRVIIDQDLSLGSHILLSSLTYSALLLKVESILKYSS